ncbi:arginine vasopressin receptor 2, like [Nothobranchius furzeri]|uniref:Arg8-vasotocin receptor-like n=1 Tax=Nothobranchius furzeri TaxID=105023 RepID=A0A8C6M0M5_NOTFU|nr:arginine vasopressin receptor 2, like [Nothobranchius furzeri]KAF7229076.1 arg8-vasotocin receptor-like [Nothobranchius furzeri]
MEASNNLTGEAADEDGVVRFALVRVGVLGLVFVLATCGNFFFLGTLWKRRKRNTRTHLFLLHLCLADLVVAFFQVLPQLSIEITRRFRGSDFLCRTVKYLQVVGMFASAYMIVAMAIDRYHAVCMPMVSFLEGSCRRYISIGAAWLISLLFSSPQLFIFSLREVEVNQYDCWATFIEPWGSRIYISWITLAVFALPAVILLFCQMRICTTIYFNMKTKALQSGRAGSKGISNAMLKTLKMTFVIIMAYTLCWSPFFVVQLWSAWSPGSAPTQGPVFSIIMLLASLNSCTNPWIYLYYS